MQYNVFPFLVAILKTVTVSLCIRAYTMAWSATLIICSDIDRIVPEGLDLPLMIPHSDTIKWERTRIEQFSPASPLPPPPQIPLSVRPLWSILLYKGII